MLDYQIDHIGGGGGRGWMKLTIFRSRDEHIEGSERLRARLEDRGKDNNKRTRIKDRGEQKAEVGACSGKLDVR